MVVCPLIPPFDPNNWVTIENAFRDTPSLTMTQHWQKEPHPHFLPATVSLGHNGSALLGLARLPDHDIFTKAQNDQEMLYLLGDVFEIFLRNSQLTAYTEFHVTPNGKRLQLAFPDHLRTVLKENPVESFIMHEPLFDFRVTTELGLWKVWFAIPISTLQIPPGEIRSHEVRASFSRYDYSSNSAEAPILSSTSPHEQLDYHRLEEWTPLTFA